MIERSVKIWRLTFMFGPRTVRPRGFHKIARNVIQLVMPSGRYLCIAYPLGWQGE